jgi:hypothetical protein
LIREEAELARRGGRARISDQDYGREAVVVQDEHPRIKTGEGLHDADLQVGEAHELARH